MENLSPREVTTMFLALGILLASARLLGELARRWHLPSVLGEILAGILLGPTVLGALAPALSHSLFPATGGNALVLDAVTTLAIVLFLLVAGIEVNLSTVWRQGRAALSVALAGIVAPFSIGFFASWLTPKSFGYEGGTDPLTFALFLATALSISALPVIAKTLMDLNLYRSDLGVVVIAAAVCNDLVGWLIFAVILGHLGIEGGHGLPVLHTIGLTVGFALFMLTVVRALIHRLLPWIQAYLSWPGGVLGFAFALALLSAAFTEAIGVHAIFGSFLAGVALGNSTHLRERTRTVIDQFVSSFFAPLFFASIGLRVDFLAHFDLGLTLLLLVIALLGKVLGGGLGARWGGVGWREAWGIGFGLSAQGTMGIILGILALQYQVISQRVFVALVLTALVTSVLSGPALQLILRLKKPRLFFDFLPARAFAGPVSAGTRAEIIELLAMRVAEVAGIDGEVVVEAVFKREHLMPTGLGHGIAVPHARLPDLEAPIVGLALSPGGIDFDAPDGRPAHLVFLILTSEDDNGAQIEILADIARTCKNAELRDAILQAQNHTQFLAIVKSAH